MIILGPLETFNLLRRTGKLPRQMPTIERQRVIANKLLLPLPRQAPDQDVILGAAPQLDHATKEELGSIGLTCSQKDDRARTKIRAFVDSPELRRKNGYFSSLLFGWGLPQKSILQFTENVYILSPALCLLLLAKRRDLCDEELVFAVCELCSQYSYGFDGQLVECVPITSIERIKQFLDDVSTLNNQPPFGTNRLRKALSLSLSGARSPFEIASGIIMIWPVRYGGICVPKFEVNRSIDLTSQEQHELGKCSLEADFMWPKQHVILEYDGNVHNNQFDSDSARINVLRDKGYTVEVLTKAILKNPDSYLKLMKRLERLLGFEIPMDANSRNKQRELQRRVINIAEHRSELTSVHISVS